MMDNREYNRLKDLVNEHLLDFLPTIDRNSIMLDEAMRYSLSAGGKRIRPVLLLAACDFCGGDVKQALPYACAIEYVQTYSLIHDDLPAMDNDDLRRGKPTNHVVYGEAMALLAGDGLLNTAYEVMTKNMMLYFDDIDKLKCRIRAANEIAKGSGCRGMVAGQAADIESENRQCSKEMIDYIHLNKTAALIKSSVLAGAYLGNADKDKFEDLRTYAECVGFAFQIVDDILDICGDEAVLGKKVGVDAQQNKSTYPAIYGLDESKKKATELLDRARKIMEPYYDEAEVFTALVNFLLNEIR